MVNRKPLLLGLTDHVEGLSDRPTSDVLNDVSSYILEADRLGIEFGWFAEHHAHVHEGHVPAPLLYALHLAGRTKQIRLGTAIICLNLHHPLAVAEQVAIADMLTDGRMAVGFGSGSSPQEFAIFGLEVTAEAERHARFSEALELILSAWEGNGGYAGSYFTVSDHVFLPKPLPGLRSRCWQAVNSVGSAQIAGRLGFNMLYSHLRTPQQYAQYHEAYCEAGGRGLIAANRPVFVAQDDETAFREIEQPLRTLWRRFQSEGKVPADMAEPETVEELSRHPINFIVGGPESVAAQISTLRDITHFDVMNAELRWSGLTPQQISDSLNLLATDVRAHLDKT